MFKSTVRFQCDLVIYTICSRGNENSKISNGQTKHLSTQITYTDRSSLVYPVCIYAVRGICRVTSNILIISRICFWNTCTCTQLSPARQPGSSTDTGYLIWIARSILLCRRNNVQLKATTLLDKHVYMKYM